MVGRPVLHQTPEAKKQARRLTARKAYCKKHGISEQQYNERKEHAKHVKEIKQLRDYIRKIIQNEQYDKIETILQVVVH